MAIKHLPPPHCAECDVPEAKIIMLFMREHYCGRKCLDIGKEKFTRMIRRATAEGIEHG